MRTSVHDREDIALAQFAQRFERESLRSTWEHVAGWLATIKRTTRELKMRLASLKKTFGKCGKKLSNVFIYRQHATTPIAPTTVSRPPAQSRISSPRPTLLLDRRHTHLLTQTDATCVTTSIFGDTSELAQAPRNMS
ncbi:hypothetical protein PC128_g17386 [Phytophthora cactorum]|nr:hypothetical protein PC128_g17386 [Phytophthora cactorum]